MDDIVQKDANDIKDLICDDEEQLSQGEYLGTFRWKKKLSFPKLSFPFENLDKNYRLINTWADFIEKRVNFDLEPHLVDALSYPLSVINSLNDLQKVYTNCSLLYEKTINIVFIGSSQKCEERIAIESNYFDEIYYYLLSIRSIKIPELKDNLFILNFYFVGEEISMNNSYSSTIRNTNYHFHKSSLGSFLKEYALELQKSNSLIMGLNTGFGAGFTKLTSNWISDLIKLVKLNYIFTFTFTNDYEDMVGEIAVFEEILKANFLYKVSENPFKSMTTYQGNNNTWSCGNHGYYCIQGTKFNQNLNELAKIKPEQIINKIIDVFNKYNIKIK
jgi:hypothetical protein